MEDKDNIEDSSQQIDLIIQGLKDLHQKLSLSKSVQDMSTALDANVAFGSSNAADPNTARSLEGADMRSPMDDGSPPPRAY